MNFYPPAPGLQKAHPGQDFALIGLRRFPAGPVVWHSRRPSGRLGLAEGAQKE
jgi:hypothetical protein